MRRWLGRNRKNEMGEAARRLFLECGADSGFCFMSLLYRIACVALMKLDGFFWVLLCGLCADEAEVRRINVPFG